MICKGIESLLKKKYEYLMFYVEKYNKNHNFYLILIFYL